MTIEFTIKSPDGEIIIAKNLTQFAKQHNLQVGNLHRVINGTLKSHKGWTLPETKVFGKELRLEKQPKEFALKSPTGEIVRGKNISKFARENNLSVHMIYRVIKGNLNNHKGWTLPGVELITTRSGKKGNIFTLKSPEGKIITGKNIAKFCRENDLIEQGIHQLINGKLKSYKGWTLPQTTLPIHHGSPGRNFTIKSPNGQIVTGINISKFARDNKLNLSCLNKLFSGKIKSYKGWTLP